MTRRTTLFGILAAVILLGGVGFLYVKHIWENFLVTPIVTANEGYQYTVQTGASYKTVTADLDRLHIITHPYLFTLLFQKRGDMRHLKAGEYLFPAGTTPNKLIDQIVNGTGMVYHSFTIVPGMNFMQLRQALDKNRHLNHATQKLTDAAIMQKLNMPGAFPEGMFYPNTYYFVENAPDLIVLKRAHAAMQDKLMKAWNKRAAGLPFTTPYQALIAASIIEKEATVAAELPIIAGVMMNRLRQNILLQFDPTVIYGVWAHYNGVIHRSDLEADNSYNTYIHKGLPPTPISMPDIHAIEAVMHPDANNYLYFVARGDGSTHQFSRTLEEHNAAVAASRKFHPWFFNYVLVKEYLLNSSNNKIFNTN
jgi:UPF0755 protein